MLLRVRAFSRTSYRRFHAAGLGIGSFTDVEILNHAGIFPDLAAPSVAVTSPLEGATLSGTVTVSASASDDVGVVGVQFKLDGANLGSEDTSPPYSRTWTTTSAQNGVHTLTAVSRDATGKTATAPVVTVTVNNVDTTLPSVSLTSPANGTQVAGALTVAATASDNVAVAGVTFLRNGNARGPEDSSAPYSLTVQTGYTQNGTWTLTARARDAAGNHRTSSSRTVTVNNPVPVVLLNPSAYLITQGTLQSGSLASLVSNDNAYLAVRSTSSGLTRYATTEFEFAAGSVTVSRLAFSVIVKSSASSTSLRLYAYRVSTGTWTQLHSSNVGTSESSKDVSITAGASGYRDAAGRVRLRLEASRLLGTPCRTSRSG